jgi:hypothetical protein
MGSLVCSFPTALDQNDQQDDGDDSGDNPDDCWIGHDSSPFLVKMLEKL